MQEYVVKSPDEPSPPTSLTLEHRDPSHSTADVASEILSDNEEPQYVHHHKLPAGWTCRYQPETDQYSFELVDEQQASRNLVSSKLKSDGTANKGSTTDHVVQTSRRPTFNFFECQYGYHFPSSPTSSMISELARQVQKTATLPGRESGAGASARQQPASTANKPRLIGYGPGRKLEIPSDHDQQLRRLSEMFPTATGPIVEQMIRIYHGREGLIKAALISLGYKRSNDYDARQAAAQSPIMLMMSKPSSKKLFDKLVGYFPDKDGNLIKTLMYQHKEVEHEVISALVESGAFKDQDGLRGSAARHKEEKKYGHHVGRSHDENGAIMKLRYLKYLYPTCEEIELYHLLLCNDLNAQKVMELIEKKGHQRENIEEVMKNRKSQTQQMRAQQAAHAAKDKLTNTIPDPIDAHMKRVRPTVSESRIRALVDSLKKALGDKDHQEELLLAALESSDYNESLAKKFLEEMDPIDEELYKKRYQLPQEEPANYVAFPCKAIQESGTNFMSILSNEFVYISKEVTECNHALALLKVDASTYTQEDFPRPKSTHRLEDRQSLRIGSVFDNLRDTRVEEVRKRRINKRPSNLREGTRYAEICHDDQRLKPNSSAAGRNKSLAKGRNGSLHNGHNPELLKRNHPFFRPAVSR